MRINSALFEYACKTFELFETRTLALLSSDVDETLASILNFEGIFEYFKVHGTSRVKKQSQALLVRIKFLRSHVNANKTRVGGCQQVFWQDVYWGFSDLKNAKL